MSDPVTIVRSYTSELTLEGRTVEGVVVPYGVEAEVADDLGPTPVYRETFTPTSFAGQLQGIAAGRASFMNIGFTLDHRDDLDRYIGCMTDAESSAAGLVARFTLRHRDNLDLVRSMLAESHTGLSVQAIIRRSKVRADGVVERLQAHLVNVAAVPMPAYAGAGITAMRAADDDRPAPTPMLDAVAVRWGFVD